MFLNRSWHDYNESLVERGRILMDISFLSNHTFNYSYNPFSKAQYLLLENSELKYDCILRRIYWMRASYIESISNPNFFALSNYFCSSLPPSLSRARFLASLALARIGSISRALLKHVIASSYFFKL
jgi:hypothetical protein